MPVRILQVVTKMDCGGLETMLMNYYRKIDREKIQFDFLTHRQSKGHYDEEIAQLGGKVYYGMPLEVFKIDSYLKWIKKFFEQHCEYQIIHSHLDSLSAFILYGAKEAGIEVRIAHSHNVDFDKDKKYLIRQLSKKLIPLVATEFWGCSEQAIRFMFGVHKVDKKHSMVVHNAIDIPKFSFDLNIREQIRKQYSINNETLVIGHIGRFTFQKNQEFLLDILSELLQDNLKFKLLLIGKGDRNILEYIHRMNLEEKVLVLGERENISDFLQAMDIFCFPSRYEGLGMAVVEAQAAGLKCIVSKNVPDEALILPSVKRIGLEEGPGEWAKYITKCCFDGGLKREKNVNIYFSKYRYDINLETKVLQKKYLKLLEYKG